MALPHFNKIPNYYNNIDPIKLSEFEIKFEDKFMMDNCTSIKNDIMIFNLYVYNDELQPFNIIEDMINNNKIIKYLEIVHNSKDGTIKYVAFLKNFSFVDFVGILDFDWNYTIEDKIKKLNVKFKYDKIDIVTGKNYNNFIRKIKLDSINKKDS